MSHVWALIWRLPAPLLAAPERILLATLCIVVGGAGLFPQAQPSTLRSLMPEWAVYVWAVTLLLGGLALLVGILRSDRPLERAGLGLTIVGSVTYAVVVTVVVGLPGLVAGLAYLLLAAAYAVRLLVSTAGRQVLEAARREEDL